MSDPVVELDPPAHEWASMIDFDPSRHASERERFGLPTDRPIIMAGHQGEFWHAGIAAKVFAAQALAERIGGTAAWLVVDTGDASLTELRVPARDERGRLTAITAKIDRDTIDHPRAADATGAYERHEGEASPEVRATMATMDLLPGPTPTLLRSSSLSETEAFRAIVERFENDAMGARQAYNDAVRARANGGVAELMGDAVPFWRVTPSGARLPARETDLRSTLWPRALAMTGVVRASLCDVFIHGTGGRGYEPINDRWLGEMMGWRLAPYVTATATLRLRFEGRVVTEADAARAAWHAQHARHHPGDFGDAAAQRERDAIVRQISALPRADARRAGLFADLHAILDRSRTNHAGTLDELRVHADTLAHRASERALREDRTWPAVLHERDDLLALRDSIDAAFG